MDPKLHVNIKNKETTFFDGDVTAVSSYNDVGLFDILPMHENFISIIKDKIILHRDNAKKEIKIENGLLKVKENKVNIYLDL
jgi:F0F1-type ATP synthase epsilon subunit